MIDADWMRSIINDVQPPINAANLRKAHRQIETDQAKGEVGFEIF